MDPPEDFQAVRQDSDARSGIKGSLITRLRQIAYLLPVLHAPPLAFLLLTSARIAVDLHRADHSLSDIMPFGFSCRSSLMRRILGITVLVLHGELQQIARIALLGFVPGNDSH